MNIAAPLVGAWLLAAFVSSLAFGQTTTGRIAGTVKDASGGAIAGVMVSATSLATAQPWTATTDGAGAYALRFLPTGSYDLTLDPFALMIHTCPPKPSKWTYASRLPSGDHAGCQLSPRPRVRFRRAPPFAFMT